MVYEETRWLRWTSFVVFLVGALVVAFLVYIDKDLKPLMLAKRMVKLTPDILARNIPKASLLDKAIALDKAEFPKILFTKTAVPLTETEQASIALQKAQTLIDMDDLVEAEILLIENLQKYPNQHALRAQLADLYLDLNRDREVEQLLKVGLKMHPKASEYILQLTRLYQKQNNPERALSVLLTMPKVNQEEVEYIELLASNYYQAGLYGLSAEQYTKLLKIDNRF